MIIYKLDTDDFPVICCDCPIFQYDQDDDIGYCKAINKTLTDNNMYHERNNNCPLIRVMDILPVVKDKSDELQINDVWDGSDD